MKRTEKEDGQTKIFRYCSNDKQTTHCVDHLAKRRYVSDKCKVGLMSDRSLST